MLEIKKNPINHHTLKLIAIGDIIFIVFIAIFLILFCFVNLTPDYILVDQEIDEKITDEGEKVYLAYQPQDQWTESEKNVAGYSIRYPSNWKNSIKDWETNLSIESAEDEAYFKLAVSVEDVSQSDYQNKLESEFLFDLRNNSKDITTEEIEFNNIDATRTHYQTANINGIYNHYSIYFFNDNKFYTLDYNYIENDQSRQIADKLLSSFKLIEPDTPNSWQLFENEEFKIRLPEGWEVIESKDHNYLSEAKLYYLTNNQEDIQWGISLYLAQEDIFADVEESSVSNRSSDIDSLSQKYSATLYDTSSDTGDGFIIKGSTIDQYFAIAFKEIPLSSLYFNILSTLEFR